VTCVSYEEEEDTCECMRLSLVNICVRGCEGLVFRV
jgi:hypothetical protein